MNKEEEEKEIVDGPPATLDATLRAGIYWIILSANGAVVRRPLQPLVGTRFSSPAETLRRGVDIIPNHSLRLCFLARDLLSVVLQLPAYSNTKYQGPERV